MRAIFANDRRIRDSILRNILRLDLTLSAWRKARDSRQQMYNRFISRFLAHEKPRLPAPTHHTGSKKKRHAVTFAQSDTRAATLVHKSLSTCTRSIDPGAPHIMLLAGICISV